MTVLRDEVRRLTWNGVLRISSGTLRELALLRQWQWLPANESEILVQRRLERTIRRAWERVPYWRRVLSERGAVSPQGLVAKDALARLPLLDKVTLRRELADMIALPEGRGGYWNTSGGSTGEPVRLRQDVAYRDAVRAAAMLFNDWAGYSFGQTMIKVWGSERDIFEGKEHLRTRVIRWLRGEVWLNAFRMTPQQTRDYLTTINDKQPVLLLGYVESVLDLAQAANTLGIKLRSPRSVMTSAGPLEPMARATIEHAFGAPVFNRYGSREVGDVACDCELHGGLHVIAPYHHVEILRPDGTPCDCGEVGEIVLTLMINDTMPLFRYRVGDMASWSADPCKCGRSWPLLARVAGRVSDMFVRPDKTRIHGEYFTHLFYFLDWVEKFQVIQLTTSHVLVRVASRTGIIDPATTKQADIEDVTKKIKLVMGEHCRVDFEFAERIDASASGKFRYTISKVLEGTREA